jgi:hypothetical protein
LWNCETLQKGWLSPLQLNGRIQLDKFFKDSTFHCVTGMFGCNGTTGALFRIWYDLRYIQLIAINQKWQGFFATISKYLSEL